MMQYTCVSRYVTNPNQIRGFDLEPIQISVRPELCMTEFGRYRIWIRRDS